MKNYPNRGFIALITAIILSLVLILVAIAMTQSGFLTRQVLSESESKERSTALAEACADTALLFLANNPAYTGPQVIAIGSSTCDIHSVTPNASTYIIKTMANPNGANGAVTRLKVVVNSTTLAIQSWEEVASF